MWRSGEAIDRTLGSRLPATMRNTASRQWHHVADREQDQPPLRVVNGMSRPDGVGTALLTHITRAVPPQPAARPHRVLLDRAGVPDWSLPAAALTP
jgi:hypothetical protein